MSQEFIAQPRERNEQSVVAGIVLVKAGWYDISLPNRDVKYIYYPGEAAKKNSYYREDKTQVDKNLSFIYSVIKEKLRSISVSSPNQQPIVVKESNKTSPKIDFSAFDINNINKMADISTIYKGEVFKDGGTHYRKDGSILYSNETDGYRRVWYMSLFTGNEEMGIIGDNSVLVTPNYFNDPHKASFFEYGYTADNGNTTDPVTNKEYATIALMHTHPNGSAPSRGDGNFMATHFPLKPMYVLGLPRIDSGINLIYSKYADTFSWDTHLGTGYTLYLTLISRTMIVENLVQGVISLRQFTIDNKNQFKQRLPG